MSYEWAPSSSFCAWQTDSRYCYSAS